MHPTEEPLSQSGLMGPVGLGDFVETAFATGLPVAVPTMLQGGGAEGVLSQLSRMPGPGDRILCGPRGARFPVAYPGAR